MKKLCWFFLIVFISSFLLFISTNREHFSDKVAEFMVNAETVETSEEKGDEIKGEPTNKSDEVVEMAQATFEIGSVVEPGKKLALANVTELQVFKGQDQNQTDGPTGELIFKGRINLKKKGK